MLYPFLLIGSPEKTKALIKGAAYKYRKEHKIQLTIINAHDGDPHFDIKKSIIYDPFVYFVIYDRPELYQQMKDTSKDAAGNVRIFIDTPML